MPFVDESKVTEWTNRLKSYFALLTHKHDASDITSGALGVARGGTGGSTALDARKNLSVPVDSSIAYVESTTATTNHAVGDYFMLGSVLMKATAAIATGETINASKATPATVQGQIDTLRDSVGRISARYMYTDRQTVDAYGMFEKTLALTGYDKTPVPIGTAGLNCITQIMTISSTSITVRVYNIRNTSETCQGSFILIQSV